MLLIHEAKHSPPPVSDHYFHTGCPYVCPNVYPKIIAGRDCGLAEWIVNDSCLF